MGKRKSRQVQAKGPAPKVDKVFDCPYCSRMKTVEIKLNKREGVGQLFCRVCGVKYQRKLGPLMKEVDIYCDWIDEAHAINSQKQKTIGLVDASDSEDDLHFANPEVKPIQKALKHEDSEEESKELPKAEKAKPAVEIKKIIKSISPVKNIVKQELNALAHESGADSENDSAEDLF